MATVIDALVVTLGLEAAAFKKGAKETDAALTKISGQATKSSKEMEAWGKNAATSLSKLRNEALSLLAVFTAGMGIKNFIESAISSTASLGRLSENLNITKQDLAEWQLANKNAGGSVEGMTAQLEEAQKAVADYKLGISNASNAAFFTVGGKGSDMGSAESLLRARSNIIQRLIANNGMDVARAKARDMGISDNTFNLLKKGADEVDRVRASMSGLAEQQARMAPAAEEFRKKWDAIKNQFEAVGVKILTNLMPQFDKLANWIEAHKDDIARWAEKAAQAIGDFVAWVDKAAQSVGGWSNVLMGLIALNVLSAVANLVTLARALTGVATGLGLIGGATSVRALGVLKGLAGTLGLGASLFLATDDLNANEDKELARRRRGGAGPGQAASGMVGGGGDPKSMFARLESQYGLPAGLLDSVWAQESGRGKNMRSLAGAKGHFQFMDATAKQYGVADPDDLAQSADGAARMLRDLIKQNGGSLPMALAAYNWGQGNLMRKGFDRAPAETRNYPAQVIGRMSRNQIYAGGAAASNSVNIASAAGNFRGRGASGDYSNTSETNINGPINIVTQASDADGIARDMRPALNRYMAANQANTGVY